MKYKLVLIGVIIIGLTIGLVVFKSASKAPVSSDANKPDGVVAAEIKMNDDGFEPSRVVIKAGQAVRFINASSKQQHWPASNIHPTHDLYSEFDVRRGMAQREQWVFTFQRKGDWPMHDHLYPFIKGIITVE